MIKRKDGRWQEQIKLPGMEKPKYFYGLTQREVQRKLAAWSVAGAARWGWVLPGTAQRSPPTSYGISTPLCCMMPG